MAETQLGGQILGQAAKQLYIFNSASYYGKMVMPLRAWGTKL